MLEIPPPSPKAQRLLGVIVSAIRNGDIRAGEPSTFLTYASALERLKLPPGGHAGQRLANAGLRDLALWTTKHGLLPKIDGIIVDKRRRIPGKGFMEMHDIERWDEDAEIWWKEQTSRAIRFPWPSDLSEPIPILAHPFPRGQETVKEEEEAPDYHKIITIEPRRRGGRPCIRGLRVTVGDILGRLAAGRSEQTIIEEFPELTRQDIRASLAYAADRERPAKPEPAKVDVPSFASKWAGKFQLPEPDPEDARLTYLLERYEGNRS